MKNQIIGGYTVNGVYLTNCLDAMKRMPDNAFDLVITDPPYGIDIAKTGKIGGKTKSNVSTAWAPAKDYGASDWDKRAPHKGFFDEMIRVSKNQVIFGGNYFVDHLHSSNCWIVWDKDNGGSYFADCELAWTSFKTSVRKVKWRWAGLLQQTDGELKEKRFHITQKPQGVMRWIIENYSSPGELILDPFAGSGSTLVAARDLGRGYMGFEIEPKYVDICKLRLAMCDDATKEDRQLVNLPLTFGDLLG